jgi:hypothetical protein
MIQNLFNGVLLFPAKHTFKPYKVLMLHVINFRLKTDRGDWGEKICGE